MFKTHGIFKAKLIHCCVAATEIHFIVLPKETTPIQRVSIQGFDLVHLVIKHCTQFPVADFRKRIGEISLRANVVSLIYKRRRIQVAVLKSQPPIVLSKVAGQAIFKTTIVVALHKGFEPITNIAQSRPTIVEVKRSKVFVKSL